MSLVTTSSGLVTLLAALGTFVSRGERVAVPRAAALALLLALIAFALAAASGIMATWLHKYTVADLGDLVKMRTTRWKDDVVDSRNAVTFINIKTIESLRAQNERKVRWLIAGLAAQLLALTTLAVTISVLVWASNAATTS